MAVEVDELYTNLNQLLEDICKFLTDKSTYEKLSPLARRQADALISRSKQQLQEIEKVSTDCNVAYVDMEKRPGTYSKISFVYVHVKAVLQKKTKMTKIIFILL
jgi:hypothetical protein